MLKINEQRVVQLQQIKRPGNVRELRRTLGAFAYVQRWLPGLSEVSKPLYEAVTDKPYSRLRWNSDMETAFETIKVIVADAVSLHLPDLEQKFVLVSDCSQTAAGAMLAQRDISCEEKLRPVAFYHHALSKSEQKYSATEKELLAVILAVKKFRVYLGKGFDLITDHHALKWLRSLDPKNETGRRSRWIDYLQQFDMNIIHKKGKSPEMKIADYLSRVTSNGDVMGKHPGNTVNVIGRGDPEHPVLLSKEEIVKRQKSNESIRDVMKALADGEDLNRGQ